MRLLTCDGRCSSGIKENAGKLGELHVDIVIRDVDGYETS